MKSFRQYSHEPITLTAPGGGVTADSPLIIGGLFVVPTIDADAGDPFTAIVNGVCRIQKSTSVSFLEGAAVYWDVADEEVNTDTTNQCVGHALEDVVNADTHVLVRIIDAPLATVSSLTALLDGLIVKQLEADGTQIAMTVNDTYVNATDDALELSANTVEDNDTIEWEAVVKIDGMNAPGQVTVDLLCGSLSIDTVVLATADTNDWVKLKGSARFTAVGASSTLEVFGGEGCGSDGGSVTRDTPTYSGGATGPATTSAVTFTVRAKAATGNAANLATVKHFKIKHHKPA